MPKTVSRDVIDALMPKGAAWSPQIGKDYDNLLNGIGENSDSVREFLSELAFIRDPNLTQILSDLEKEFGLVPLESATEDERRAVSLVEKTSNDGDGSNDFLEKQLRDAGFDVYVHDNDPPVDPNIFLNRAFKMFADGAAFAGNDDAYAGRIGGELLVNGAQFEQEPDYLMIADGSNSFAGNDDAVAGRFDEILTVPVKYYIPGDSGYWGLIFFVGGEAVRDGTTGELIAIEAADVPIQRKSELFTIILKFKPMHSWAGLIIDYV